jgi:hypothetical protein
MSGRRPTAPAARAGVVWEQGWEHRLKASRSVVKRWHSNGQLDDTFQRRYPASEALPVCPCPGALPEIPRGDTR